MNLLDAFAYVVNRVLIYLKEGSHKNAQISPTKINILH